MTFKTAVPSWRKSWEELSFFHCQFGSQKVRLLETNRGRRGLEKQSEGTRERKPDRKRRRESMVQSEEGDEKEWLRKSQDGWLQKKSCSSHQAFALVQITARPGRPRGKSTFLHLSVRPWNPVPFFQMAWAAADWAGPASFDPPSYPIQPKQPSHYWLQLFGTGNLIPVPRWRPICEVVWWKSLPPSLAPVLLY